MCGRCGKTTKRSFFFKASWKASKDQKEVLACALQNSCSIIGKAQCRISVSKLYPVTLLKQGSTDNIFLEMFKLFSAKLFHKRPLNDWLERVILCLVRQAIIASAGQLYQYNRESTVVAFRILVKSHKSLNGTKPPARRYSIKKMNNLSKFIGKNLWLNPFIIKLQSLSSLKENSVTVFFLLL